MRREVGEVRLFTLSNASEIAEYLRASLPKPFLIACVGTELRGDDRAGLELCRELERAGLSQWVVECPYGLENCLHVIEEKGVRSLLVVDAAVLPEGADFAIASPEDIESFVPVSTHQIPLPLVAKLLREHLGVERIVVLGIAVENLEFSLDLSPSTRARVEALARALTPLLE